MNRSNHRLQFRTSVSSAHHVESNSILIFTYFLRNLTDTLHYKNIAKKLRFIAFRLQQAVIDFVFHSAKYGWLQFLRTSAIFFKDDSFFTLHRIQLVSCLVRLKAGFDSQQNSATIIRSTNSVIKVPNTAGFDLKRHLRFHCLIICY